MILTLFQESTWSLLEHSWILPNSQRKSLAVHPSMNQVIPPRKTGIFINGLLVYFPTGNLRGTVAHLGRAQYTETTHLFGDLFHFLKTKMPSSGLRLKKKRSTQVPTKPISFLFGNNVYRLFFCRFLLGPWLCIYAFVFLKGFVSVDLNIANCA